MRDASRASIRAERLTVRFILDRQQRMLTPSMARLKWRRTEVHGLWGVGLQIGPGEGVALLGPSGAGKTTLLRALAGVLTPDEGRLTLSGQVGSLLSINAGLLPVLTGRENSLLLGVLRGMSRAEARAALGAMRERSRLGDAFERPVASYSQGMKARLGFAVADCTEPQILLLDEVHEALDHEFRAVVATRAREILDAGGVVVATGHDHTMLESLCGRAVWLHRGAVQADGDFAEVRDAYLASTSSR